MRSLLIAIGLVAAIGDARADDLVLPSIELRPGVTADIHVREFASPAACSGPSVLVVHGIAHTAASWQRFAASVLATTAVCRVHAIDLPGHGGSSAPRGLAYGEVLVEDYAVAVLHTLEELARRGAGVDIVVGHSMGGIVLQQVQVLLALGGRDLLAAFGVRDIVLLASTASSEVAACAEPPPPLPPGVGIIARAAGPIVLPDDVWRSLFFSDRAGTLVPGAPPVTEVAAYNAAEAPAALLQVIRWEPLLLPVPRGMFMSGRTRLTVVVFEDDPFASLYHQWCMFDHLAAGNPDARMVILGGDDAPHDAYIAAPAALVSALQPVWQR